jgi:hypothetical protein
MLEMCIEGRRCDVHNISWAECTAQQTRRTSLIFTPSHNFEQHVHTNISALQPYRIQDEDREDVDALLKELFTDDE